MIPASIALLGGGHDFDIGGDNDDCFGGGGMRTSVAASLREGARQIGARGTGREIGKERARLHYRGREHGKSEPEEQGGR